MIWWHTKL